MHSRNPYETAAFARDAAFVCLLVLASGLTYALSMGFHADDYCFLALFRDDLNGGRTLWELATTGPQSVRPLHVLYLGLLYDVFGASPVALHAAHLVMLAVADVLLLALLREIGWSRPAGLTTVAIYAVLPHYSTVRFWYTAFQETLALQLALAAAILFLLAVRGRRPAFWICGPLSALALAGSGLAYEMQLPAVAAIPLVAFAIRRDAWKRTIALGALHFVVLIAIFAWKISITTRTAPVSIRPMLRAVCTSFLDSGVLLPVRAYHAFPLLDASAIAVVVACSIGVWIWLVRVTAAGDVPATRIAARALGWAFVVFCLGYLMTVVTGGIEVGATGMRNRTALVAAIGLAMLVYPMVSLLCRHRRSVWRWSIPAAATAIVFTSMIVVAAEGRLWAQAWDEQQQILRGLQSVSPRPDPASAIILDGSCAYVGPAKVFSEAFDLEWALRYTYGDPAIVADVTSADFELRDGGLLFRGAETRFFPWQRVTIYNAMTRTITTPKDRQQAVEYFARRPHPTCPEWITGLGAAVFGCAPCDRAAASIRQLRNAPAATQ
jgi:hypothetical protein